MNLELINNAVKNMISDKLESILDKYYENSKEYLDLVKNDSRVEFCKIYHFNGDYFSVTYGYKDRGCRGGKYEVCASSKHKNTYKKDFVELNIELPNPKLLYLVVNDRDIEDISLYQKIHTETGYFEVWLQQYGSDYFSYEDLNEFYFTPNIDPDNTLFITSLEYTPYKLNENNIPLPTNHFFN